MCWIERQKNQKKKKREIHGFQSIFLPLEENPWLPCLKKCLSSQEKVEGLKRVCSFFD
jgi:hypothetical protein